HPNHVYGQWCGPDWSGGLPEPYNPEHNDQYHLTDDAVDTVCEHHDICYDNCRQRDACDASARASCMRQCDYSFHKEMWGAWTDNPFAAVVTDTGISIY